MRFSPESVTAILAEVAESEILPRFRALESHEVQRKESGELVTVADEAAERAIEARLRDLHPGALVVGEEAVAKEAAVLEALAGPEPVWLIDPIDGTGNFAAGRPLFAVMVALVQRGETLAAWIHDPLAPQTAVAEAGSGAWLGERRLSVEAGGPLETLAGSLHGGMFATAEMKRLIERRRDRLQVIKSLRCAGHEYIRMAEGERQFSLFTKMMPWDHAPGMLIHREAGGYGRRLDGVPYSAASQEGGGILIAPDQASWEALHDTLFEDSRFARG